MGYDSQIANDMIHSEDYYEATVGPDCFPNKKPSGPGLCPLCEGKTHLIEGKFGKFYGCKAFPKCTGSRSL